MSFADLFEAPSPFRPLEDWKSALLTLPDSAFFELLRSVFGNITTPYNKHRLMEDLTAFLSRQDIQEALSAYIGPGEHRVIAAIALLGGPAPGELERFLTGEYSYVELHGLILNLEERFIVYRFRDDGGPRLALNPLLKPVLDPFIARPGPLFPSTPLDAGGQSAPRNTSGPPPARMLWDPRLLAALFAFFAGEAGAEGLRKKALEEGQRLFPGLALESFYGALLRLGLVRADGGGGRRGLWSFAALPARDRLEYLAAGMYLSLTEDTAEYTSRGRAPRVARFIRRLTSRFAGDRAYPWTTIRRAAYLISRDEAAHSRSILSSPVFDPASFDTLLESLEKMGLLAPAFQRNWVSAPALFQTEPARKESGPDRPVIAMDTAFSCILYPEIAFNDALLLASFCSVVETGAAPRFELTRESAVRGFDRGLDAEAMLAHLEKLSGAPLDQNLRWTLEDWEKRYRAVSLYQGAVLCLAEDRRYLAETGPLTRYVVRPLAPGVYLLAETDRQAVAEALERAGVDIIAQPPLSPPDPASDRAAFYPVLDSGPAVPAGEAAVKPAEGADADEPASSGAAAYQERFRRALEALTLPKADRDELAARIDRRLILTESQLNGGPIRFEKTEARNLDYVGKSLVAKQALTSKSMVEIHWPLSGGGENRLFGIPEGLEKKAGETILVLKPLGGEGADAEPVRLPLGKISLIRRMKKSLFGE